MKYRINEPYIAAKTSVNIQDVIDKQWLSVKGEHTLEFERLFAKLAGVKYSVSVNSGTAALHVALLALGVGKNDTVIIPNYTCGACAVSVKYTGAEPLIVDVEFDTWGLDANAVEAALQRKGAKVVMLVHCYGFPARDTFVIRELCNKYGAYLLEDASEAHGALISNKPVGSIGEIACFSCRSDKMIGIGEAGVVVSNDAKLIEDANYWASRAAPYRKSGDKYWYAYHYTGVGMNYLLSHLPGAVGRAQIEEFDKILELKKAVGQAYQKLLPQAGFGVQKVLPESDPVYWVNAVLIDDLPSEAVHQAGCALQEEGIEIRPPFWPLGDLEVFSAGKFGTQSLAHYLFEHSIVLPSSVNLAKDNCAAVTEIVNKLQEIFLNLKRK